MVKKWLFILENSEIFFDLNDIISLDEWENEGGRIIRSMKWNKKEFFVVCKGFILVSLYKLIINMIKLIIKLVF